MSNELFTDGGKIVKMEVDYSETVTEKLPICEQLTKVNNETFISNKINFTPL